MPLCSKKIELPNGLVLCFTSSSRRYFGDYHTVQMNISCTIQLRENLFLSVEEYERAEKLLGKETSYTRVIEKTGVPSADVEDLIGNLFLDFQQHSLPYFNDPEFQRKFVATQIRKLQKREHPGLHQ